MRENEPENFARIRKIMLPKDYINFLFTGVHCCDYSDASGILCLDVKNRRWSEKMLEICGITEDVMPSLYESYEVVGTLKKDMADRFGLSDDVKVVAGAGDNAAAAVGTGTVFDGLCNISLGTSGTVFISNDSFKVDRFNALHSFAHANGKYHLMGVVMSAASCNKWFCQEVLHTSDYNAEQAAITDDRLGRNGIFFLPYLMGERSPMNDVNARGAFVGMSMNNDRADMMLAVLEGVAFAIRDSIEIARDLGIDIKKSYICGGGAKSKLWRRIFANVLNIEIMVPEIEEGPGYGGAMLAMVGNGEFGSVEECAGKFVRTKDIVRPEEELVELYERRYQEFRQLYPALKGFFNR
jgi:xylulokinase